MVHIFSKRDITAGNPQKAERGRISFSLWRFNAEKKYSKYHDGKLFKYLPKHDNDLDKEYIKPGLYAINPCSRKRDSHNNKTIHQIDYCTICSVGEILNKSRSIAKRLVECMPPYHWTIAVISCDQVTLWRTSCVCEASFRPNAIRSQRVSMNNCMYTMTC